MADLSDIEASVVGLVAAAIFPNTTYLPGDVQTSSTGIVTRVYRGWPESAQLNADLALGRAHVSIFPEQGMTRNVSRYFPDAVQVATVAPTITATASGAAVTLAGTVTAGNVVGVQFLRGVDIVAYAYAALQGDTLTAIAAALATKSGGTSSGAVLTLPGVLNVACGVMVPQPVLTITRQQEQGLRVTVWAATPQARDALCSAIDGAISGLRNATTGAFTRFFSVAQYEAARIALRTTYVSDMPSRDRVWRRDLCYTVEYPTTLLELDPQMLFLGGQFMTGAGPAELLNFGATQPATFVQTDQDGNILLDAAGHLIGVAP